VAEQLIGVGVGDSHIARLSRTRLIMNSYAEDQRAKAARRLEQRIFVNRVRIGGSV